MATSPVRLPHRKPRDPAPDRLDIAARELTDNLLLTDKTATAWFRLGDVRWSYLTTPEREQTLTDITLAYAALTGRPIHLRVTSKPYGAHEWARRHVHATRAYGVEPPSPDQLADNLANDQRHMWGKRLDDTHTYLGVHVTDRSRVDSAVRKERDRAAIRLEYRKVTEALALPGLSGSPLGQSELEWLVRQSVGLHLPQIVERGAPSPIGVTDVPALSDHVDVDARPLARTVRIIGHPAGAERWVATLALGRMEALTIPETHQPWVAYARQLPFPVEWSIRGTVLSGQDARKKVQRRLDMFADQRDQYREHGLELPPQLEIVTEQARARHHQMSEGDPLAASSIRWQALAAVAGASEEEALEYARQLVAHYQAIQVYPEHPRAQHALYRSFTPGEKQATVAHTREGGLRYFAAAVPALASTLGDREGMYLGWTAGSSRRVCVWNPHRALFKGQESGATPVTGKLGSGKTTLIGKVTYESVMDGVPGTLLLFGGMLRLHRLPELAGKVQVLDVLNARPGDLSVYGVVPDLPRSHWYDDPDVRRQASAPEWEREELVDVLHRDALERAERTRRQMANEVLRSLLEPQQRTAPGVAEIIGDAVDDAPADRRGSLDAVVDLMSQGDQQAQRLARTYRNLSRLVGPSKFFSTRVDDHEQEPILQIVSLAGVDLDQPEHAPLAVLAAWKAANRIFAKPMLQPAVFGADEIGLIGKFRQGDALLLRIVIESRKLATRALLGCQDPAMLLRIEGVQSAIDDAFAGTTTQHEVAARTLDMLGVARGTGYERELARLSPRAPDGSQPPYREFLARLNGRVERLVVDLDARPGLLAALTPGAAMPGDPEWEAA